MAVGRPLSACISGVNMELLFKYKKLIKTVLPNSAVRFIKGLVGR